MTPTASEGRMLELTAILLLGGMLYLQSRRPSRAKVPVRSESNKGHKK